MTALTALTAVRAGLAGLLIALAPAPAAHAQTQDTEQTFDGAAIRQALRADPIHVLPDALAQVDRDRLATELAAAEPAVDGRIFVVVAPFTVPGAGGYAASDLGEALEPHLADGDQLLVVAGLEVTVPSWPAFANGDYADRPYRQLWNEINNRHREQVLLSYDVTNPLIDLLRLIRHEPPVEPAPTPPSTGADSRLVATVTGHLRDQHVYVDPSLGGEEEQRRWDPFRFRLPEYPANYRVAYLPAPEPGAPVPDLLGELATAFPDDVVVVVNGHWPAVAGPGDQSELAGALTHGLDAAHGDTLLWGERHGAVERCFERLVQLRDGVLDPRAIPTRPEAVNTVGQRLASWTFAGTALALAAVTLAGLWWLRLRRRRATAKALRLGSAQITAALARLAVEIGSWPASGDHGADRRRQAEAAQRYTAALDLLETATTPGELAVANRLADEGLELVADR